MSAPEQGAMAHEEPTEVKIQMPDDVNDDPESAKLIGGERPPPRTFFAKLDALYFCEAFNHRFHWTECVMLAFLAVGVLFVALVAIGVGLPGYVSLIALASVSTLALLMVWGIARVKSLAAIADQLEKEVHKTEMCKEAMLKNNEAVKKGNDSLEGNLKDFATELGLFEEGVNNLQQVEGRLGELAGRHEMLIEEERVCEQKEAKYIKMQKEVEADKRKENTKKSLLRKFDRCAHDGCIDDEHEMERMMRYMEEDKYLRELSENGVDWKSEIDKVHADGKMRKWELADALDHAMHTHFKQIRFAEENNKPLVNELNAIEQQLANMKRKR